MRLNAIALLAAPVAILVAVPAAGAKTIHCSGHRYRLIDSHAFPSISNLDATNLPTFTSGYAPRCLVAESLAADIQFYWSEHGRLPNKDRPYGARWRAPTFKITYTKKSLKNEPGNSYKYAVAKAGKETITMHLGS